MTSPVRSVSQAFAILRLLSAGSALKMSDIGRSVGLSPSSCLNLLNTLVAEGAVERESATKRYRLTLPWQSAEALRDSAGTRLMDHARPAMEKFAQSHKMAVGLWQIVTRERMQLVLHAESDAGMRLTLADKQRQPLGAGAAGRAIAAAQKIDKIELARRFAQVRWQDELSLADYMQEVKDADANGFSLDRGHAYEGVYTIAVALADIAPGYCLTASFVAGSRTDAELKTLGIALANLGNALVSLAG